MINLLIIATIISSMAMTINGQEPPGKKAKGPGDWMMKMCNNTRSAEIIKTMDEKHQKKIDCMKKNFVSF